MDGIDDIWPVSGKTFANSKVTIAIDPATPGLISSMSGGLISSSNVSGDILWRTPPANNNNIEIMKNLKEQHQAYQEKLHAQNKKIMRLYAAKEAIESKLSQARRNGQIDYATKVAIESLLAGALSDVDS